MGNQAVRASILALAAMLAGPALAQPAIQSGEMPATGYLVLSFGPHPGPIASMFLEYASEDGKTDEEVSWIGLDPRPNDFDVKDGERGIVYVKALPPGAYHFYRFAENDGSFVFSWRMPVLFTVTAGHVTYAGDFSFVPQFGKGIFGLTAPHGGFVTLSNAMARDIPIAGRKLKNPGFADLPVDVLEIPPLTLNLPPFCMMKLPERPAPESPVLCSKPVEDAPPGQPIRWRALPSPSRLPRPL